MGIVLNWNSTYPGGGIDNTTINFPPVSDGIHDVLATHVNALANAVINLETAVGALGGFGIREVDSTPNIRPVHTLVVPNGSLTNLGSNTVELNFAQGSGGEDTSTQTVTQTAHGFTLTNLIPLPVYWTGSVWDTADISNPSKTKQAFIVEIINTNSFVVQLQGFHALNPGHGLSDGNYYWSQAAAPYYTSTAPTSGTAHCLWMVTDDTLQLLNQAPYALSGTSFIETMNPAPAVDVIITADGSGDLKNSGVNISTISANTTLATDALYPLVQAAHTTSTRTLIASDAGNIIPLSAASNAIAVTIPHTLWEAGGAGRAFVCQLKVLSVAGGAITFVGSGGIVVTYSGKNPGSSAYAAGDYLTLVVDSATTARVFTAVLA